MGRLTGKVAIITGGAGGIGKSTAKKFVEEGADVLIVDLKEADLEAACQEIGSNKISYCVGNVTSAADNEAMVALAVERYGGVDVFVANAGIEGDVKPITEYDEARFDQLIAVNVKGPFLGLKSAIPALKDRGGGSIIITSSVAGLSGTAGVAPYVTSKHAVVGLMKSAAQECAPDNIRVNTINPSPVETRMMRSLEEGFAPGAAEAAHDQFSANIPLGRYAEAHDIAQLMVFLASDDSSFITGSTYVIDGGMTS